MLVEGKARRTSALFALPEPNRLVITLHGQLDSGLRELSTNRGRIQLAHRNTVNGDDAVAGEKTDRLGARARVGADDAAGPTTPMPS